MAKCAVCGRTLTSARSIAAGVGPDCGRSGKGRRHKKGVRARTGHGGYDAGIGSGVPATAAGDGATAVGNENEVVNE